MMTDELAKLAHAEARHESADDWQDICPLCSVSAYRDRMATWAESASLDDAIGFSTDLLGRVQAGVRSTYELTGTLGLFSGGNDSSTFMHFLHRYFDSAAHINTGIGVDETRRYVRRTVDSFGLPLIEQTPPPGDTYDELVLRFGFPGPAGHGVMYRRLKERGLRQVRRSHIGSPRTQRVVFVAGMRYFESDRRMKNAEEMSLDGSIVWTSPLMWWTNDHMAQYRQRFDVPRNEVSDHLHMSGECLCGAFAKPGELEQIRFFYPDTAKRIDDLACKAKAAQSHCVWGTRPPKKPKGAGDAERVWICFHDDSPHRSEPDACDDGTWWMKPAPKKLKVSPVGPLCDKCEVEFDATGGQVA